jgi:hypothetical protein
MLMNGFKKMSIQGHMKLSSTNGKKSLLECNNNKSQRNQKWLCVVSNSDCVCTCNYDKSENKELARRKDHSCYSKLSSIKILVLTWKVFVLNFYRTTQNNGAHAHVVHEGACTRCAYALDSRTES